VKEEEEKVEVEKKREEKIKSPPLRIRITLTNREIYRHHTDTMTTQGGETSQSEKKEDDLFYLY
jgi:hypothetical protein